MRIAGYFIALTLAAPHTYPEGYRYSSARKLVMLFVEPFQGDCDDEAGPFEPTPHQVDEIGLNGANGEFLRPFSAANEFRAKHGVVATPVYRAMVCLSSEMSVEMTGTKAALEKTAFEMKTGKFRNFRRTTRMKISGDLSGSSLRYVPLADDGSGFYVTSKEAPLKHPKLDEWKSCGFSFRGLALPGQYRVERKKKGVTVTTFYFALPQDSKFDPIESALCG